MSTTTIRSYDGTAQTEEKSANETTQTTEHARTCPECGGDLEHHEARGETTCAACGLVVEDEDIDRGPEWRAFDSAEKDEKSRVGAPTTNLMHDNGLSTNIGWQDKDAYGNSLSSSQRQKMQRLRKWNERFRTQNSKERNLKQALAEIERMGSALGLPENVRETASVIYRRALGEDLLPGRSIEGVASAALYAAGRQANHPRSVTEVATVSRVDDMEFKRTYRYIVRELGLAVQPADPASYVGRIASELDLADDTERRARELLATAEGTGVFNGKSPVGLAAAAIYAAGRLTGTNETQDDVAAASDVSTVTIRNRYKELLDVADEAGQTA
jgi:transcription initiation factor TFIIB